MKHLLRLRALVRTTVTSNNDHIVGVVIYYSLSSLGNSFVRWCKEITENQNEINEKLHRGVIRILLDNDIVNDSTNEII